jgi:2-polyprenyl-6-methoxyphenol hydroxylase-like FAD-dependent oxidoreductase
MFFLAWSAPAASLPTGFRETAVGSGWNEVVGLTFAADGRMYVWERGGKVWLVENGVKSATPFIDLREEVGGWRDFGLLGFAFDPRFRAITAATKPDDMRFDELVTREALSTWGRGPLTLVGDAAHPLMPHTGQGAAQALEDAVALGLALAARGDVERALRRYERVRSRRTRRLVTLGPRIARITTTRNPLVKLLRTTAIQWLPASVLASNAPGRGRDPHAPLRNA